MKIEHAESDEQIATTFEVMRQLRPHLVREEYVPRIRALMASDDFRLAFLTDEGEVATADAPWRLAIFDVKHLLLLELPESAGPERRNDRQ